MGTWQHLLADAFAWAITLLVPAIVWGLLGAGLYQLVRDSVRSYARSRARPHPGRIAPTASRTLVKRSTG